MSLTCNSCNKTFDINAKYCNSCGKALSKNDSDVKIVYINRIITFYSACLLFSLISYFISSEHLYSFAVDLGIEISFALLVIGFSITDFEEIMKLYKLYIYDWKVYVFTIVFPILSSIIVYFLVDLLYQYAPSLETINYYYQYSNYEFPFLWGFIFVAILPPVFEELAFRGYLFNQLSKITTERNTIIATAFIFALIHFSFISFLWIFPFGLVLGYLRSKYKTLWLGMIIHFIHNAIILLIDYYQADYFA